jgi:hypothetical protein
MVDDGDINLSEALAKFAESQKYLAQVLQNDIVVQQANQPVVLRSAAEQKRQQRRNSFDLQRNMIGLATGGRVIKSLDNDDTMVPSQGLRYFSGSSQQKDSNNKISKSYELMRLLTGRA